MKRDEQTKRRRKVYISGHYFLQYFNVKSSGFLEPSYRFLQEKPSGRSGRGCSGIRGARLKEKGGRGGSEKNVAPHGAFPAMQSLKGEPRHYAVAVVHGPLPHHPFDSPFPLPSLLFSSSPAVLLIVSFRSLFPIPDQRRALLPFLFHRGESFATVYTYPNGIRHSLDSKPIQ